MVNKYMRIIISSIALLIVLSILSCSGKKTYRVFKMDTYDNDSDANLSVVIASLWDKYRDMSVTKEFELDYLGESYKLTYENTIDNYWYHGKWDMYQYKSEGKYVEIGINRDTKRIDVYTWWDKSYLDSIEQDELTRDQCLNIAEEYLSDLVNISQYELVNETYLQVPEFNGVYTFYFNNSIDGIKTLDNVNISITSYGRVTSHALFSPGDIYNVKLPSEEEYEMIYEALESKMEEIYEQKKEDYDISYELTSSMLVRMKNGKYGIKFNYSVTISYKEAPDRAHDDLIELFVYI